MRAWCPDPTCYINQHSFQKSRVAAWPEYNHMLKRGKPPRPKQGAHVKARWREGWDKISCWPSPAYYTEQSITCCLSCTTLAPQPVWPLPPFTIILKWLVHQIDISGKYIYFLRGQSLTFSEVFLFCKLSLFDYQPNKINLRNIIFGDIMIQCHFSWQFIDQTH